MIGGRYVMTQVENTRAIREGSFGFLIQTLAREIDAKLKLALNDVGVDVRVFTNLMLLSEEDGISQRALGEKLKFPEYSTSRNVDALVEVGYAERRPNPNSRRSFLIFLTGTGRKKASELPGIIKQVNDETLSNLTTTERRQVIKLLQKAAGVLVPKAG
jgi:DNA-binding MarR family transcriptional regulator